MLQQTLSVLRKAIASSLVAGRGASTPENVTAGGDVGSSAIFDGSNSPLYQPDILLHIYSFMRLEEVLYVASVCKTWQQVAYDPLLWADLVCPSLAAACNYTMHMAPEAAPMQTPTTATPLHGDSHASAATEAGPHASHATSAAPERPQLPGPPLSLPHLWLAFHGRNFLRNPNFLRNRNSTMDLGGFGPWSHWRNDAWVEVAGGEGAAWESPPIGCPAPLPLAKPYPAGHSGKGLAAWVQQLLLGQDPQQVQPGGCIATSYHWTEVVQVIDFVKELQQRGLTRAQAEHLLDAGLPLGFSLQIGTRFDCGAQFSACLCLLEKVPHDPSTITQRFVAGPSRYHFFSSKLKTTRRGEWQRFAHVVDSTPKGFRFGVVLIRGKDTSFWAGHFGAKLSCAELTFIRQQDKATFCQDDDVAGWIRRMQEAGL